MLKKNYLLFDSIEPIAIRYKNDSVKFFLHANPSHYIPSISISGEDNINPKYSSPNKPIIVELKNNKTKEFRSVYTIHSQTGDTTLLIRQNNIFDVKKHINY